MIDNRRHTNVKLSAISKADVVAEAEKARIRFEMFFKKVNKFFHSSKDVSFSSSSFTNTLMELLAFAKGDKDFPDCLSVCQDIIDLYWLNPFESESSEQNVEWQKWEKAGVLGQIVRGALIRLKYNSGEALSGAEVVYITGMSLESINKNTHNGLIKGCQTNRSWSYFKKDIEEYMNSRH